MQRCTGGKPVLSHTERISAHPTSPALGPPEVIVMAQGKPALPQPPPPTPPRHIANQCSLFSAKVTLYLSGEERGATSIASPSLYPNEALR